MKLFGESQERNLKRCMKAVESALQELGLEPGECLLDPSEYPEGEIPDNCLSWHFPVPEQDGGDPTRTPRSAEVAILLSVHDDANRLEVRSLVARLPDSNILPLYRRLLELNAEQLDDVAFGVSGDFIVLTTARKTKDITAEQVGEMIEAVAALSHHFQTPLRDEFACLPQDE